MYNVHIILGNIKNIYLVRELIVSYEKKRLKDAWYANNISFWLDIKIFFNTIVTVLKHDNVYTN